MHGGWKLGSTSEEEFLEQDNAEKTFTEPEPSLFPNDENAQIIPISALDGASATNDDRLSTEKAVDKAHDDEGHYPSEQNTLPWASRLSEKRSR